MERLDSRIRLVWILTAVLSAFAVGSLAALLNRRILEIGSWLAPVVFGSAVVVGTVYALVRFRMWGFDLRDDSLYVHRGVFRTVQTVAPYVRVQHVDSQRGPLERSVGLATVVVYTAGSRGADITIPGLTPERAEDVQAQLRALAIESEGADAV